VLGIDPGLTRCGVGIVDVLPDRRVSLVHVGVIRTAADDELAARLLAV
jgi:crossover junction endodeoxyribonuclease RuvC